MKFLIPVIISVVLLGILVFSFSNTQLLQLFTPTITPTYHSKVTVSTTGYFAGRETPAHQGMSEIVSIGENTLYEASTEALESILTQSANNYTWIALCNATAANACNTPQADQSENFVAFVGCGLANASGTYNSLGTGNWTIDVTFTSSCDGLATNSTRLQNWTHNPFAGEDFTHTNLDNTDTININWSVWVQ